MKCIKKPILINRENPLPEGYKVTAQKISKDYEMNKNAACCAIRMINAAKCDGINLIIISAYRSADYQKKLFDEDISKYMSQGMSYKRAVKKTSESLAFPGESEHNSGLAVDLLSDEWNELTEEFENTKAFRWLDKSAYKFGFVLRYPRGKQNITGIIFEPWHYRYVGGYWAKVLKESGKVLEELYS